MADLPLHYHTITELAEELRSGEITSTLLVQHLLERISLLDGKLNAFRLPCSEKALEQAQAADRSRKDGKAAGILSGIPYAVKDLFDVQGLPTTAGARLLENNIAAADSQAVGRLYQAGMILSGKTNYSASHKRI